LEHGYAVTIYQAQGSTLDSAYVMADPAMDRQEFYVAASRTRGETFFYATPEVGFDRMEMAPAPPRAEDLEHIARAAERDGSQAAAHDAALRERLGRLSTEELYARRRELASEAHAEAVSERRLEDQTRQLARASDRLDFLAERREGLGAEPPIWARSGRAEWREEASLLDAQLEKARETVAQWRAEAAAMASVEHAARAEQAVAEHLIEERIGARLAAVRIDPPDYLSRELGERPTDPSKRWAWDSTVAEIERYRQQHGIRDRDSTLGAEPKESLTQLEHRRAMETLRRTQRQLGLEQPGQARAVEQTRGLGIEM
jgi:hypothetical protein